MPLRKRARPESDLRRPAPSRRPRECILIVCEGTETEPNYLRSLRRQLGSSTVDVEIVGQGAEIVGVVDEAIRRGEERAAEAEESNQRAPYDEVWCVVDTERRNDNPSWERGRDKARAHALKLAWSNPCFEFWILLHFQRIGRSFDGYAAIRPFVCRHIPNYEKSLDCFAQLSPRIPAAIENSHHIHRSQWQTTPKEIDRNPATTVHDLVERLLEVVGMTLAEYREKFPMPPPQRPKSRRPPGAKT